jgi:prepilin signal peptidase PulO-like enzyme (type II secretory pathway)
MDWTSWLLLAFLVLIVGPALGIFSGWWMARHRREYQELDSAWSDLKRDVVEAMLPPLQRLASWLRDRGRGQP